MAIARISRTTRFTHTLNIAATAAAAATLASIAGLPASTAHAQGTVSFSRVMEMGDGFEPSMMMEAMGGMSADEDDPASQMKTDLGRAMLRADFSRDPASVLRAQMQLAAKQRDALVKPPEPKPADAAPQDASPNDDAAAADPAAAEAIDASDTPIDPAAIAAAIASGDAVATDVDPAAIVAALTDAAAAKDSDPASIEESELDESGMDPATAAKMKARAEAMKKVAKQVEDFRTLVVAGDWPGVAAWLKREGGEDAGPIYAFMLQSLTHSDSALVPDEVIALSEACPVDLTDKHIQSLGQLLQATQTRGADAGAVAAQIRLGTTHFGGPTDPAKRKRAATLFVSAGLPVEAQAYLPPLEEARAAKDADLLDIYVVYYQALAAEKQGQDRQSLIDQAWSVAQEVLSLDKATAEQRAKAVEHAMQFLKDVEEDAGNHWLASSLAEPNDVGWTIVQSAHQNAARAYASRQKPDERLAALTQLRRVGRAIISANGAAPYRRGLDMLTLAIVTEAEYTKNGNRAQPNRYYYDEDRNSFQPIPADQLSEVLPDAPWLASIDPGLSAKLEATVASTLVGSGDLSTALSMIRPIASTDSERAGKLVVALLNAWPNFMGSTPGSSGDSDPYSMYNVYGGSRFGGYNPYAFGYGYGRANSGGIPLTRARQIRALAALRTTLDALREMNLTLPP